jgi:uncharacterized protein YmfQ (DUF2313 family)
MERGVVNGYVEGVGRWVDGCRDEVLPNQSLAWGLCWQVLQQELALYWTSMEELNQKAQSLAGSKAPEQLGVVQERLWEQLRALQELAIAR